MMTLRPWILFTLMSLSESTSGNIQGQLHDDWGLGVQVMFLSTLDCTRIPKKKIAPYNIILLGFDKAISKAVGCRFLTILTYSYYLLTKLLILDTLSPYNMIMGRIWLYKLSVIPSTYHQVLHYLSPPRNNGDKRRSRQVMEMQCERHEQKQGWTQAWLFHYRHSKAAYPGSHSRMPIMAKPSCTDYSRP